MAGSFVGTWFMCCVVGAVWLMGYGKNIGHPTWGQLLLLLATWAFFDVAFFIGIEIKKVIDNRKRVTKHGS